MIIVCLFSLLCDSEPGKDPKFAAGLNLLPTILCFGILTYDSIFNKENKKEVQEEKTFIFNFF
jgi:hypothetical protein